MGVRTTLNYQQAGVTRYFDASGFAGRTVGLPDTGGPPLFTYLVVVGAGLLGSGALGIVLLLARRDSQNFRQEH